LTARVVHVGAALRPAQRGASPRYRHSPGNEEQVAVEEHRCAPLGRARGPPLHVRKAAEDTKILHPLN